MPNANQHKLEDTSKTDFMASQTAPHVSIPRVAITYCTQCKWMLRAAYFAQELLSTFGTTIGEVALVPAIGGIFTVTLSYVTQQIAADSNDQENKGGKSDVQVQTVLLWDRKAEGGFPETKILKQRVRDHLDPKRDLGHSDTPSRHAPNKPAEAKPKTETQPVPDITKLNLDGTVCEDCR